MLNSSLKNRFYKSLADSVELKIVTTRK